MATKLPSASPHGIIPKYGVTTNQGSDVLEKWDGNLTFTPRKWAGFTMFHPVNTLVIHCAPLNPMCPSLRVVGALEEQDAAGSKVHLLLSYAKIITGLRDLIIG